jgi:hypothetical protein
MNNNLLWVRDKLNEEWHLSKYDFYTKEAYSALCGYGGAHLSGWHYILWGLNKDDINPQCMLCLIAGAMQNEN